MKTIQKQLFYAFVLTFAITVKAQDRLMALGLYSNTIEKIAENTPEYKDVALIDNKTFTYDYKGGKVLVVFNGKEHIEYYNNKKHSIKSSIKWVSKKECFITLEKINLPNFPFEVGTKLKMEITKIRGKYVYYKSTLGGRTWLGKMKEIDRGESYLAAN